MSDFLKTWKDRKRRTIVFAGVFDPVHNGHIAAAEVALSEGSKVLFLPERVPQHKHGATPYTHRLNMLEIAIKNQPGMSVVDYPRKHHWVQPTFIWLRDNLRTQRFIWLVGSDVAPEIHTWAGSENLAALGVSKIVCVKRRDTEPKVDHVYGTSVVYVKQSSKENEKISSSMIRSDVEKYKNFLPDDVYDYIKKHNLYN